MEKDLHRTMVHELVRNGLDQCSRVLRRRVLVDSDVLELRFDRLSMAVQAVIHRAREVTTTQDEEDDEGSSVQSLDDDGWAYPSESPPRVLLPPSPRGNSRMEQDDDELDPHPFATRKRKPGSNANARQKRPRGRTRAKRSKKSRGSTPHQSSTAEVPGRTDSSSGDDDDDSLALGTSPPRNSTRNRPKRRKRQTTTTQRELTVSDSTALHRFLDDDGPTTKHQNSSSRPVETSMVHRMEQWIERNTSTTTTAQKPRTQRRGRRHPRRSAPQHSSRRGTHDDDDTSNELIFADILSQSLGQRGEHVRTGRNVGTGTRGTRVALPLLLEDDDDDGDALAETTHESSSAPAATTTTTEDPVHLLGSLRVKITSGGSKTLQDHTSLDNHAELRAFVSILTTILRLLDHEGTNQHLASSNGIVHSLFAKESRAAFMDCVVLQFVDAVMSLMHPRAWGLSPSTVSTKLEILKPLRDALGLHFLLTERVSRCILHELGVQEWHCVRGGERAYISAVDPASWKALLESGQHVKRLPSKSRFASFAGFLPRCEVDALWKLLAYSSCRTLQPRGTNESCRWQLLSQLFSKGSLSSNESDSKLAPSQGQISAAQSDLSKLTELVKSRSLGELPRRDKFLFDLVHRALLLHTRSVNFGTANSARRGIAVNGTKDEKEVIQLLVAGDVRRLFKPNHALVSSEFALVQRRWLEQPLFLPPSKTVHACLRLAVEWQAKLPPDNIKRAGLFDKSIKTLATNLERTNEKTTGSTHQTVDADDPFLGAFGQDQKSSTPDHVALSKLEGPAFISVFCCPPTTFQNTTLSEERAKYVWSMVSDATMKERHAQLHGDLGSTTRPANRWSSALRLELASKAMTCMFLLATGQLDSQLGRSSSETEAEVHPICYVLSCVMTCFDCACDMPRDTKTASIIQCHLATVATVILKPWSPGAHRSGRWNVITNWFATKGWNAISKSNVLARSFHRIVGNEVCGVEEDLSLQCLLVMIIKAASLLSRRTPAEAPADRRTPERTVPLTADTYELLETALQNSRPSARHSLSSLNTSLSTQGMCILNKRFSLVCHSLASLADPVLHHNNIKSWLSKVRFAHRYDEDENYRRKTSLALIRNLVLRQQSERSCSTIFDGAREEFLSCAFTEILDVTLLQKIPSCNLGRMTASATNSLAEQKAFEKLVSFGRGESRPAIQARESKRFIESMGHVFTELGETMVGGALISYGKGGNTANEMPLSLERECLETVLLVINIMDATAESQQIRYEQLVRSILWTCCWNMIEILVSADVQARANEDVDPEGCRRAQHFELFSCYCEVLVSVLAYAFYRANNDLSGDHVGVLSATTERLLSPVLSRHEPSLLSCLSSVLSSIEELDVPTPVRRRLPSALCSALEAEFSSIFRGCVTRRYMFFLHGTLCISQFGQGSFIRALFGSIAYQNTVSALSTTRRDPSSTLESSSPIQPHLEEVFKDCYNACDFSLQMKQRTIDLRYKLLDILVPRLGMHRSAQMVTTIRAVLDVCRHEGDGNRQLPPRLPCSIIRGLWMAAQFGLSGQKIVENGLLVECFLCAHSLIALPASYLRANCQGTVLDCIQTSMREEDQYVYAAIKFLRAFGEEIIEGPSFPQLRSFIRDKRNPRKQEVSWPLFSSHGDETATLLLRELEQQLFGKGVTIVNVYATPSKPEFIEPLAPGVKPTPKLLAAAAELVSFFKSDLLDQ